MGIEQACVEGQESVTQKEVLGRAALLLLICQKMWLRVHGNPGDPSAFHTAQSLLILLLEEISGCSFSLGVFIIKSQTEDKKTWLLKWCNFRVSGFRRMMAIEGCRSI